MKQKYLLDYDPETELFCLNDLENQVIIVISKEQLESLIKFYNFCFGGK